MFDGSITETGTFPFSPTDRVKIIIDSGPISELNFAAIYRHGSRLAYEMVCSGVARANLMAPTSQNKRPVTMTLSRWHYLPEGPVLITAELTATVPTSDESLKDLIKQFLEQLSNSLPEAPKKAPQDDTDGDNRDTDVIPLASATAHGLMQPKSTAVEHMRQVASTSSR